MKRFLLSVLSFSILGAAAGEPATLSGKGRLVLNDALQMEWRDSSSWKGIDLKQPQPKWNGDTISIAGKVSLSPKQNVSLNASLKKLSGNRWRYRGEAAFDEKNDSASMEIKLPVSIPAELEISGKPVALTGEKSHGRIFGTLRHLREKSLSIVAGDLLFTFRGSFRVRVNDQRVWSKEPYYSVHLLAELSEDGRRAELEFEIETEPLRSMPIPLGAAANMGLCDDTADDGRGGWTDQGPKQDLSCMQPGDVAFSGIRFKVADPEQNGGRSCVVRSNHRTFPAAGAVELEGAEPHRYLYLLHAAAWVPQGGEPVGVIAVTYKDGARQEIPVRAGVDCGNWWRPMLDLPNGPIAWTGENGSGKVGLFASAFRLDEKPVARLEFLPGKGVWMVAAASFANLRPGRTAGKPIVISEGKEWKKYDMPLRYLQGSPMDFSGRNHVPAGKFGHVVIRPDGHFAFENAPEQRIRFFGTNICQRLVAPTHEEADILVERLAMEGYNSVRFHQFEMFIMDWSKDDSLHFNPETLDRFQYFYAKLREKGMYITTDVCASRPIRPGDNIAECRSSNKNHYRKVLHFFSDSALENWKEYARRVFTLKNPYTGMSMAEDPAFFALNLDNEAPLYAVWNMFPELLSLVAERYAAWLRENGIYSEKLAAERGETFYRFLAERQRAVMEEESRFLREELGVKAILTNLNNNASPSLQPFRDMLPLLDAHIYHDHPTFPMNNWQAPVAFHQNADIAKYAAAMRESMPLRIPGKPLIVTEINYCYPNRYRSEMGAVAGAYSALQDWDGLYRFCYEFRRENIFSPKAPGAFSTLREPISLLTERIIWFLFVRGDVAAASNVPLAYTWNSERYGEEFPPEFSQLGLIGRIGSVAADSKSEQVHKVDTSRPDWIDGLPPEFRKAAERFRKKASVTSLTGEIELEPAKVSLRVVTPKSEVLTFHNGNARGRFLDVKNANDFATVSVHSLDGKPLAESRDLLLFHLTDALASEEQYQTPARKLLLKDGKIPMLVARGRADVTLAVAPNDGWRVEALAADGSVLAPVKCEPGRAGISFPVETHRPEGATMIYHLSRP